MYISIKVTDNTTKAEFWPVRNAPLPMVANEMGQAILNAIDNVRRQYPHGQFDLQIYITETQRG